VIRAGYGIYYTLLERIGSENQMALNPPFLVNVTPSSNTTPVLTPEIGFPANFLSPPALDPTSIANGSLLNFHIRAVDPAKAVPMVQQWSLGLQREFASQWLAEVDYVGTKSTHLDLIYNYDGPIISGGATTSQVPYPAFSLVEYTTPTGYGNYNGLQASLSRSISNGFSLRAAYTYSRSLDNTPEELENNPGGPPNGRDETSWYGPSEFNTPHRVSLSYVYELPFGKGKPMLQSGPLSWILGNWRTSGVFTYYSGPPFTAIWGNESIFFDPTSNGYATAVPKVVGKVSYVKNPNCWFYYAGSSTGCSQYASGRTDPFVHPGTFVDAAGRTQAYVGNGTRNALYSPDTVVFDASLMKDFPIWERLRAQLRWEVFNVANHALFGAPGGDVSGGSGAQITTLSGDPRVMQLAFRFDW
jgi:hypothetical protein